MWLFALVLGSFSVIVWAYLSGAEPVWKWCAFLALTGLWWLVRLAQEEARAPGQHRAELQNSLPSAQGLPFGTDSASTLAAHLAAPEGSEMLSAPAQEPAAERVSLAPMAGADPQVVAQHGSPSSGGAPLAAATFPVTAPTATSGFEAGGTSQAQQGYRDYARNAGRAGYLYAARNKLHMPGLFKLGQTMGQPARRVAALNDELRSGLSLGSFELVHAVETADAYGCEQALFAALTHRRLVDTKEFFLLDIETVLRLLQTAAVRRCASQLFAVIDGAANDGTYRTAIEQIRSGATFLAGIPDRPSDQHGWVLALRNDCHAANIVRLMHVETDPYRTLAVMNDVQARDTARVGKYALVGCWVALDARATVERVLSLLGPHRRFQRSRFVRASLDELSAVLRSAMPDAPAQDCAPLASLAPQRTATTHLPGSMGRPHAPQRREPAKAPQPFLPPHKKTGPRLMNFCPNRECNSAVHVAGADEDVGEIRCSGCRRRVGYAISGGVLEVWEANK